MKTKIPYVIACALATTALPLAAAAQAQTTPGWTTPSTTYKAPRNGFGQPELSGTWANDTLTRMERNVSYGDRLVPTPDEIAKAEGGRLATYAAGDKPTDLAKAAKELNNKDCFVPGGTGGGCAYNSAFMDVSAKFMRVNGQPRTSFITFPANGRVPHRPDVKQRPDPNLAGPSDNPEDRILPDRCLVGQNYSTGALLNPTLYNNTWLFQQNKDSVVLVAEMSHDARTIRLNAQHDNIPRWFGDSVGHWEGETLVVDTVHFHPEQLLYNSDQLHLTERFTRVGPDRILYQFKVEDPGAYTQPYGGEYEFTTSKKLQYEYACHEGNYAMESILAGARQDEARAKAAGQSVVVGAK